MIDFDERNARLDGPIHSWFGLTYSNYLVLCRSMMQSMPVEWQQRAVELFDELDGAFPDLKRAPSYIVQAARESEYGARVLVPIGEDPVPHYDRGRTFIEPTGGGAA